MANIADPIFTVEHSSHGGAPHLKLRRDNKLIAEIYPIYNDFDHGVKGYAWMTYDNHLGIPSVQVPTAQGIGKTLEEMHAWCKWYLETNSTSN